MPWISVLADGIWTSDTNIIWTGESYAFSDADLYANGAVSLSTHGTWAGGLRPDRIRVTTNRLAKPIGVYTNTLGNVLWVDADYAYQWDGGEYANDPYLGPGVYTQDLRIFGEGSNVALGDLVRLDLWLYADDEITGFDFYMAAGSFWHNCTLASEGVA